MIGTILVTAVGALAFKLGIDAHKMKSEGKSNAEIAALLPGAAINIVTTSVKGCYRAIAGCKNKDTPAETEEG